MSRNLVLTGWGHPDYIVSAAVALQGLGKDADVKGVSRRRLPELLLEISEVCSWDNIFLLGISLSGNLSKLITALNKLRDIGVRIEWISALPKPTEAMELEKLLVEYVRDGYLVEVVGERFLVDTKPFMPFVSGKRPSVEVCKYHKLIEAAQFVYRNYQDEALYATVANLLANGVNSASWSAEIRDVLEHFEQNENRELIGNNPLMQLLREKINMVAHYATARVLIIGESGTGKENVANQIHNKSSRGREPFVAFNCATVANDLLEGRMFGYERGAFTGAYTQYKGLFEQANGGTLFLDEIGEMALEVQALLLRVLEVGRFRRLGGTEEVKVDVRIITATNRDLPACVREGKFRRDLFQRLNVVQLRVPSLRDHKDDIPLIANSWWRKHHDNTILSDEQIAALMEYDYPGNVRELFSLLERATVLEEGDFSLLMREHREMNDGATFGISPSSGAVPDDMEAAMRIHVRNVFVKYGKNLTKTADALNVSRNTVRKYLDLP